MKLGLGLSVRPNPNPLFFFSELSARVRVRVLEILFPFLFSDPNTDLFCSCRAPVRTAVRHLFPCGGGGDRGSSDVRHPGPFSLCFYPVRVRVTQRQPGSDTIVRIIDVYISVCNRRSG